MKQLFSTGEVARILGIPQHRIVYAITANKVTEAKFHFLGKRCFDPNDLHRLAKHFGVTSSKEAGNVPL